MQCMHSVNICYFQTHSSGERTCFLLGNFNILFTTLNMRRKNKICVVISGIYIVTYGLWLCYNKEFSILETKAPSIMSQAKDLPKEFKSEEETDKEVKEEIQSCQLPRLNPFDKSVVKHIREVLPYNCSSERGFFKANFLSDRPSIKQVKKLGKWGPCCFRRLLYMPKRPYRSKTEKLCTKLFRGQTNISQDYEYVHIFCNSSDTSQLPENRSVHEEILNFIPVKESPISYNKGNDRSEHPSVLVIGFDHQSRMNFLRQMPKSYKFMMKKLGAIEMLGFNKVGDATFNNTNAFLMGLSYAEVRKICWKNYTDFFDSCPFIWKDFAENGYLTSYSDDSDNVYSYRFKGFEKQPTDYYTQPFVSFRPVPATMRGRCFGTQSRLVFLHDYIKKTAWSLRNKPYFHFAYHSIVHQRISLASLIDSSFKDTLSFLNSKKLLNDTIVLLISDHGWRYGKILHESQGRLENRLPFAYFIFPTWFKKKYPHAVANLRVNANRLTSPYDFHATMKDLTNLTKISTKDIILVERQDEPFKNRGVSLFLPIPLNRTCASAGIDPHWCICDSYKSASNSSSLAKRAGEFVVTQLNIWLKDFPRCSLFQLDKVFTFEIKSENEPEVRNNLSAFKIILSVKPGDGEFEATVFRSLNGKLNMSAEISRVNEYAGQSYCIRTYSMIKICYCKVQKKRKKKYKHI